MTLTVAGGCYLALVGESGAGKSTLLRCINRVEEPDAGRVLTPTASGTFMDALVQ